mmetsp:Transcript_16699/g.21722  ORF Transcript_16699/g.21722 Transcript_16699/m.21722 type:complete len:237 (+) Transcript_16699:1919-2629(+)
MRMKISLFVCWVVGVVIKNVDSSGDFNYTNLYNELDRKEHYHNPEFALEVGLIQYIDKRYNILNMPIKNDKIISLGCSLAVGVEKLADLGFDAYGVDVSAESIREALAMHRGKRCSNPPCLSVASLTNLHQFDDNFFSSGLSSDVLEHIHPDDVDAVILEISRIVQHRLFLRIAIIPEKRKMHLNGKPVQLHLTVKPTAWWVNKFSQLGNWYHVPGVLPNSDKKSARIYLERPHSN